MPVAAGGLEILVLAAGGGSRMGGGKLLLPWRGKALLAHTLDSLLAMRGSPMITVVVGHEADSVAEALAPFSEEAGPILRIVKNPAWREGMSTSLRLGFSAILERPGAEPVAGILIALGDQPLVRTDTLDRLAREHIEACARDASRLATVPAHNGRRGNPVILSPALLPLIRELRGDIGARNILAGLGETLQTVEVDDSGIHADVDTRTEYDALPQ